MNQAAAQPQTAPGARPDATLQALLAGGARPATFDWVHGPLAHWARVRPHAPALRSERHALSFAQLHARVRARARQWDAQRAPAVVLIDEADGPVACMVDFLALLASGRCAAVGDAQWPPAVAQAMAERLARQRMPARQGGITPLAPFYIGFTSGSTGLPKGFMRHHLSWAETLHETLRTFGAPACAPVLAPGRMAHSLFLFGAVLGVWTGAGARLQEHFGAARALRVLRAGGMPTLVAVPSQLVLMLDQARRRAMAPIDGVRLVLISGARWMRERTPELRRLFPQARIAEFYGASEASYIAWMDADADAPPQAVGRPFGNVQLHIGPSPRQPPLPPGTPGLIWVRSPMLFMDYVNAGDATAALREGDWLSVRDMGHVDAHGLLHLRGRESRMIVTLGKNLFPEEVEAHLLAHAAVAQASLQGVADGTRGMSVHAVLQWRPGSPDAPLPAPPSAQALAAWCRSALEAFKAPRHWWLWQGDWPHTASGKTDHGAIARALQAQVQGGAHAPQLRAWA